MQLGFIILAHNDPETIRHLVRVLASEGNRVVVHFDASSPAAQFQAVCELESQFPGMVRVISCIHCKWGEWSLVKAVLLALKVFQTMSEQPDFVHLMSAADSPIRPIADMKEFLTRYPDQDYIESYDITKKPWVKGGLSMERFEYFFPVNFRTHRKIFNKLVFLQGLIGMKRKIPLGLTPRMGSQWWTLRWSTCFKVLSFIESHPQIIRYFRTTWIPDESFFPTLVGYLIPHSEITNIQLLLHHFTPIGRPYIIYADHIPTVKKLPHFFIRKVSPSARAELWNAVKDRKSPIPHPRVLSRIHKRLGNIIDHNYEFPANAPGHVAKEIQAEPDIKMPSHGSI